MQLAAHADNSARPNNAITLVEDDAYDMIILADENWRSPDLTEIYILDDPLVLSMELL